MIFRTLLEDWGPATGLAASGLFYSALHFFRPLPNTAFSATGPWAGFHYLADSLERFLDPASLSPGFISLCLIGMVLSYAFFRTGSLYLSIGLHAGWIFGLQTLRVYGDFRRQDLGWLFGSSDPKVVSGVATWIACVTVGVILCLTTREREGLKEPSPGPNLSAAGLPPTEA